MNLRKLTYYLDFAPCPIAAIGILLVTLTKARVELTSFCLAIVMGLLVWTLVEYFIHRFVYHRVPIIRDLHEKHHREPTSYESTPPFLSVLSIALFVYTPLLPFGSDFASGVTIGMSIGYTVYMGVHHALHHWSIRPDSPLYALWKRHSLHHYRRGSGNYGVTSNIWDRVFMTTRDQRSSASER